MKSWGRCKVNHRKRSSNGMGRKVAREWQDASRNWGLILSGVEVVCVTVASRRGRLARKRHLSSLNAYKKTREIALRCNRQQDCPMWAQLSLLTLTSKVVGIMVIITTVVWQSLRPLCALSCQTTKVLLWHIEDNLDQGLRLKEPSLEVIVRHLHWELRIVISTGSHRYSLSLCHLIMTVVSDQNWSMSSKELLNFWINLM